MFDVGIYSSCGSQANCPTGCVNSVVQDYVVAHSWSVDAERAKFIVEKVSVPASRTGVLIHRINKAEQERQAAVIRAEGEAEAAGTISRALEKAGEAFVAFRKIEASKAIVQSLANNPNVTYIPSGGGNVLLNVPTNK